MSYNIGNRSKSFRTWVESSLFRVFTFLCPSLSACAFPSLAPSSARNSFEASASSSWIWVSSALTLQRGSAVGTSGDEVTYLSA